MFQSDLEMMPGWEQLFSSMYFKSAPLISTTCKAHVCERSSLLQALCSLAPERLLDAWCFPGRNQSFVDLASLTPSNGRQVGMSTAVLGTGQ